jgi:hypothetical protein
MLKKHFALPLLATTLFCISAGSHSASAMSSEQLLALQKKSAAKQIAQKPQISEFKKTERKGLLESSDILSNGKYWTIVPKNAIIHIPNHLKSKVVKEPVGKLTSWKKFCSQNPAWLGYENVDIATARGSESINFERFKSIAGRGKIIVATHKNRPIGISSISVEKDPSLAKN